MPKSELIGIRVRPAIRNWLNVYEKAMNKNTSEIIRDLLENTFRQYQSQHIGKRLSKRLEARANSHRAKIQKIAEYLSNTENIEKIVATIISLESTLHAWDIHFKSLGTEIIGRKERSTRKRTRAGQKGVSIPEKE